jgi:hypothetical protein
MEALHTAARYDAAKKETKAEEVEAELLAEHRERILPRLRSAPLPPEMYQALHELEALQACRGGKAAPLPRVDVRT